MLATVFGLRGLARSRFILVTGTLVVLEAAICLHHQPLRVRSRRVRVGRSTSRLIRRPCGAAAWT
eukprot:11212501-Lingulodinium_polyedra.AAC.1